VICLGNPKLTVDSITEFDEVKTTLTRVCKITLTDKLGFQLTVRTLPLYVVLIYLAE